jgi:hypothetical protein
MLIGLNDENNFDHFNSLFFSSTCPGYKGVWYAPKSTVNVVIEKDEPPCPDADALEKMRAIRYFHKNMYQTWEKCVVLQ